jgi:hypothetical protein
VIANTDGHPQQVSALWGVIRIEKDAVIRQEALKTLIKIANTDGHPQQVSALGCVIQIEKDAVIRQEALKTLIKIANTDGHSQQFDALILLGSHPLKSTEEAEKALIDISKDETKSKEIRKAAQDALTWTPSGGVRMVLAAEPE